MTCKDCEDHDKCAKNEQLMLTVDNFRELVYRHGVDISCKDFKKAMTAMTKLKYYIFCIRWLYKNRHWRNTRQKWKAMERDWERVKNK